MKAFILTLFLLAFPAGIRAQIPGTGNVQRQSSAPEDVAITKILHYTTNVLDYICAAPSTVNQSAITISTATNANPGVATSASHGFYYATGVTQKIAVFISGATGGWATLNGLKILVPASSGTFTILASDGTNFDTSGFGAWGAQSVTVTTRAPRATDKIWDVQSLVTDAAGNLTLVTWAVPLQNPIGTSITTLPQLTGGQTSQKFACTAPLAYQ